MPQPHVSVIVPVYNAHKTLMRCVDSILTQEYRDLELILVDDGSTDDSGELCDAVTERDKRVHVIHKPNSGVSDSRNRGMKAAAGTYIQFVDADDWITPDATKLLVRSIEEYPVDMVIADFYRVVNTRVARKSDIDTDTVITREQYADLMMESPSDFYWGVLWNKLYKHSIIEQHSIRMDPSISWCEDFIFNMEYVLHTKTIYPLHVAIYYYEKSKSSLSSQGVNLANTIRMKLNVIEYYKNFFQQIMGEEDYEARRPDIYRFYIDSASDGGVLPRPLSAKLGTERITVDVNPNLTINAQSELFLTNRLLDRYLDTTAEEHDLDLIDARVLLYLRDCPYPKTVHEISEYCGKTTGQVTRSIQKLRVRNMLKITTEKEKTLNKKGKKVTQRRQRFTLTDEAQPVMQSIDQALQDFDSARFADLTQEQRSQAKTIEHLTDRALRQAFLPPAGACRIW